MWQDNRNKCLQHRLAFKKLHSWLVGAIACEERKVSFLGGEKQLVSGVYAQHIILFLSHFWGS